MRLHYCTQKHLARYCSKAPSSCLLQVLVRHLPPELLDPVLQAPLPLRRPQLLDEVGAGEGGEGQGGLEVEGEDTVPGGGGRRGEEEARMRCKIL